MTIILGIETSCDDTAAAVVSDGRVIHSNIVSSQLDLHAQFGGVFPEASVARPCRIHQRGRHSGYVRCRHEATASSMLSPSRKDRA